MQINVHLEEPPVAGQEAKVTLPVLTLQRRTAGVEMPAAADAVGVSGGAEVGG